MTPYEFAQRHFREFKTHGEEIIPTRCPYCDGGHSGDRHTFALNTEKLTYNCKRGSCGVSGTFTKLCQDHGEQPESKRSYEAVRRPKKIYILPKTPLNEAGSKVEEYLKRRGFSPEIWKRRGVGEDDKGNITMPYFENGNMVMMKFRPARKIQSGEKKAWREPGGKPVFWGMDLCETDKPLVIVEGEMDALALDECRVKNVVSVPSGTKDLDCIDLCWDWLQQFRKILIWVDSDEPGKELQRNLINRIGAAKCWVISSDRKDANEVLLLDGKEAVKNTIMGAVEVPIEGLVRLADVKPFDCANAVRVRSGFRGFDKAMGGFILGETTIWTGDNGSGKSTLLGQVMLDVVEQSFAGTVYSGELSAPLYRYWIDLQAAGPNHLAKRYDEIKERDTYYVKPESINKIRDWYKDKFFLYDSYGGATDEGIIEIFKYSAMRYDSKVFLVDNLMTTTLTDDDKDYYRKQSNFIGKMMKFAKQYQVHVHIVAHPKKVDGKITKKDISGSGDISNRADNIILVRRLTDDEKLKMIEPCDAVMEILKNRFNGVQDVEIQLNFEPNSKRFYMASDKQGMNKAYSWVEYPHLEEVQALFKGA